VDDIAWLAERGFRLGRDGVLIDTRTGRRSGHGASPAAVAWRASYLRGKPARRASSVQVKRDGRAAGYCPAVLKRAMRPAGVTYEMHAVAGQRGAVSVWVLRS
jgi:hypothetical protein